MFGKPLGKILLDVDGLDDPLLDSPLLAGISFAGISFAGTLTDGSTGNTVCDLDALSVSKPPVPRSIVSSVILRLCKTISYRSTAYLLGLIS